MRYLRAAINQVIMGQRQRIHGSMQHDPQELPQSETAIAVNLCSTPQEEFMDALLEAMNVLEISPISPCYTRKYYSHNGFLACAVHPTGRPGATCPDWDSSK